MWGLGAVAGAGAVIAQDAQSQQRQVTGSSSSGSRCQAGPGCFAPGPRRSPVNKRHGWVVNAGRR